jgi:hypothetical protein
MSSTDELRRAATVLGVDVPDQVAELRAWVREATSPPRVAEQALLEGIRSGASEATRRRLLQAARTEAASQLANPASLVAAFGEFERRELLAAVGDPVEAARVRWEAAATLVAESSVTAVELMVAARPHERPHDAVALLRNPERCVSLSDTQRASDDLDGLFVAVSSVLAVTGTKAQKQAWRDGRLVVDVDASFDSDAGRVVWHRVRDAVGQGRCSGRWSLLYSIEGVTPCLGRLSEVEA